MARSKKSEVLEVEAEEINLTPEEIEQINKTIDTRLVTKNVTDELIAKYADEYSKLEIIDSNDKEGFEAVYNARITCKNTRILAVEICKAGRAHLQKEVKLWTAKEKELKEKIAAIESGLQEKEDKYEEERQRIKVEKIAQANARLRTRTTELQAMGASSDGVDLYLGELVFSVATIRDSEEDIYQSKIFSKFKAIFDVNEEKRLQKEKEDQDAKALLEKQQKEIKDRQDELDRQEKELKDKQEAAAKKESDRLAEIEKTAKQDRVAMIKARHIELENQGLVWNFQEEAFTYAQGRVIVKSNIIENSTVEEWDGYILGTLFPEKIKAKAEWDAEIKAEEDRKAEVARQKAIDDKKKEDAASEEKRQQEIQDGKESGKYKEIVDYLKGTPLQYTFRSGRYIAKMKIIKDFLADLQ